MNKPVYLGLSILDISKTKKYEFWNDYLKCKYNDKAKLCYMDTDSFTVLHIKAEEIYKDILQDVGTRFDRSHYNVNRPLTMGKTKKVLGLMKNEVGVQIMKKLAGLRHKTHAYLKDSDDESKKTKGTKRCAIKRNLNFKDFKNCLKTYQIINKLFRE